MKTKLESFLGNKKLKTMVLAEVEKHRKADQIIQGTYGKFVDDQWKGCAVGCTVHSLNAKLNKDYSTADHSAYESALGIPEWLARLEDRIFEGLPKEEAKKWPSAFLKAIPVGVNLEPVKWKFCAFILSENIKRVLHLTISDDLKKKVVDAIRQCLAVHETAIKTGEWNESAAWSAAQSAARSAQSAARSAESAAWSAAWSAAQSAESAQSAAESAESAARSTARSAESAAWSAAQSAARSAESAAWSAYIRYSKELVNIIKATK